MDEGKRTAVRIEGNGIRLRPVKDSDFEAYYAMLQDPESNRLTGTQRQFAREEIADWIVKINEPNDDRVDLIIASKETDELFGEVVLNEIDRANRSANIRIAIGPGRQGRGFGTEAMRLILAYGFESLKLHRIHLGVYAFNPRAIRVYERLGFRREGVLRDALCWDGAYHDMILMALLEDEFVKTREVK